jgi:hypothetical protein
MRSQRTVSVTPAPRYRDAAAVRPIVRIAATALVGANADKVTSCTTLREPRVPMGEIARALFVVAVAAAGRALVHWRRRLA